MDGEFFSFSSDVGNLESSDAFLNPSFHLKFFPPFEAALHQKKNFLA